jgi:hypothetical protein
VLANQAIGEKKGLEALLKKNLEGEKPSAEIFK